MTTKAPEKGARASQQPTAEELQAAYQAHTLAQMLYGQLMFQAQWTPMQGGVDPRLAACYGAGPGVPCTPGPWCVYRTGWLR
jgi:hypothetical protein